ncbi:type VI secretion system Vgr family protein [Oceaniglobus trochenteri]|uniref:type VI secretion system Vgr family protein n=1 Tax=Oceaniglobus trochenteri TaxID=2763260 RepID=UPI001CFF9CEC|nr:type VI secretion system tip protein TssI/VgrG [Oceaniglobus trochenteri]
MAGPVNPENFPLRVEGDFSDALYLLGARVEEGMNLLTETTLEFVCTDREVDLKPLLGSALRVVIEPTDDSKRIFPGTCVSIEYLGNPSGPAHYRAELRPWLWFLGRTRENRVFQDMTAPDILQQILSDYGVWGDVDKRLSGEYPPRGYTIQYRETDLDFIRRLMEEEGIYFFFRVEGEREKLVLADGPGAHQPIDPADPVEFLPLDAAGHRMGDHVFDWKTGLGATTGKMTLTDYDFENPSALLRVSNSIPKGGHPGKDHEGYDYPGHFRDVDTGERRVRVRMEAEAARHLAARGAGTIATLTMGDTFTLANHPRESENRDWMLSRATHVMRLTKRDRPPLKVESTLSDMGLDTAGDDPYRILFEVLPKGEQYRAPLVTPWPEISGVHTAMVTGPKGEEIHTDKYGRIKVQFHWDRKGKRDENTSCWVRCMMPWTGKSWGMMAVPRIGQEVVVQFEEGDPDRPMVIGMLYNADTMPPWELPANMTQSGVKTNSTKGGGGFNELMMEDKKDAELVRFQAERDYRQIVKNDAEITVGLEHKDKGDMKLTVQRNLSETVKTGNHTFTVASGNQTIKVKKDVDETIEGGSTQTITKDVTRTVKMGNVSDTVEMGSVEETVKLGDVTHKVDLGNMETKLGVGNYTVKCAAGKITMEALQSIELKVGGSSIKIDQMGVTIKGAMTAKMEGSLQATVKGLMTEVTGDALLKLKGGVTMIN